jgi:hypothetical protein
LQTFVWLTPNRAIRACRYFDKQNIVNHRNAFRLTALGYQIIDADTSTKLPFYRLNVAKRRPVSVKAWFNKVSQIQRMLAQNGNRSAFHAMFCCAA